MLKKDFIALYEKFLNGNCTEEEVRLLEQYQDDFSFKELPWDQDGLGVESEITERVYSKIQKSIRTEKKSVVISFYKFFAAAAIVTIVLGLSLFFYKQSGRKQATQVLAANGIVRSERNQATLKLSNGTEIILSNEKNGTILKQGRATVTKDEEDRLVYQSNPEASSAVNTKTNYNSVSVPKGGEYQIVLSDGTRVWLNSSSSIRFPVNFSKTERKIELTGEAYFEVAKDKTKPFRVVVSEKTVEVLGTHFNINAYTDQMATTLLEGSVRLKNLSGEVILKPGETGLSGKSGVIGINQADIEEVVSWKNGFFVFHNESIKDIMENLSRWYDIKVDYKSNSSIIKLYGKISRYETLDNVLKNLELTGAVHFKTTTPDGKSNERRITVMP